MGHELAGPLVLDTGPVLSHAGSRRVVTSVYRVLERPQARHGVDDAVEIPNGTVAAGVHLKGAWRRSVSLHGQPQLGTAPPCQRWYLT